MSYALPIIDTITYFDDNSDYVGEVPANPLPRRGGGMLRIEGDFFGSSGAQVLIGILPAIRAIHATYSPPNKEIWVPVPPFGEATSVTIRVIQSNGGLSLVPKVLK